MRDVCVLTETDLHLCGLALFDYRNAPAKQVRASPCLVTWTNCGTLKVLLHSAMAIRPLLQSRPDRRLSHQVLTKRPVWLSRMTTDGADVQTSAALFLLLT